MQVIFAQTVIHPVLLVNVLSAKIHLNVYNAQIRNIF